MTRLFFVLVLVLTGCGGGVVKPAIDFSRAACAVVEPICAVASSACSFVPPTSGGDSPDAP